MISTLDGVVEAHVVAGDFDTVIVGIVTASLVGKQRRLGDLAASTVVVHTRD